MISHSVGGLRYLSYQGRIINEAKKNELWKLFGMPVKRDCQKKAGCLIWAHSRTVKGKNFNGVEAMREKLLESRKGNMKLSVAMD